MALSNEFPQLADAAKILREAQKNVAAAMGLLTTDPIAGKKELDRAIAKIHAAED